MWTFVLYEDASGFYTWRLDGPPLKGHSLVHAEAPQSWRTKQMALEALSQVRVGVMLAVLVDKTSAQ
jgi:hypothetical protein